MKALFKMKVTTMKMKMFLAFALLLVVLSGCGSSTEAPLEPLSSDAVEQVKQRDAAIADEESAM
jgi:outer membrane lipoprotein-sorting protein